MASARRAPGARHGRLRSERGVGPPRPQERPWDPLAPRPAPHVSVPAGPLRGGTCHWVGGSVVAAGPGVGWTRTAAPCPHLEHVASVPPTAGPRASRAPSPHPPRRPPPPLNPAPRPPPPKPRRGLGRRPEASRPPTCVRRARARTPGVLGPARLRRGGGVLRPRCGRGAAHAALSSPPPSRPLSEMTGAGCAACTRLGGGGSP